MAIRWKSDLKYSDITPKGLFMNRRQIIASAGALALGGSIANAKSMYSTDEAPNSKEDITSYNNYYEFGLGKEDPAANAGTLTTSPWSVEVAGMVDKPGVYSLEDLIAGMTLEERIYRFRCVEAWSMVVPWNGFELGALLNKLGVQSAAKYVAFETLVRPEEMVGQTYPNLEWPYREGLRLDEAMHPLTIMATGLYGEALPNQNGAPLRLVVPWKYGFKSIKSIVKIVLTDQQPETSWNMQNAGEYGFYSNVNPEVDHPRWSQASERRLGGGLGADRIPTLKFNGYEAEVASLYSGLDLVANY
jgi:methionine sulfoxide reductase catalytic subunit